MLKVDVLRTYIYKSADFLHSTAISYGTCVCLCMHARLRAQAYAQLY